MKRAAFFLAALLASAFVNAATYNVSVAWTDPTAPAPEYTASYEAQCHVNGGTYSTQTALSTTAAAFAGISANTGDVIGCRVRAVNVVNPGAPIAGVWSADAEAVAPVVGVTPSPQTNISVTVTH